MIASKIDKEIYEFIEQTGKDISVIIIHPKTALDLKNECLNQENIVIDKPENSNMLYKGYPIFRSLDVERNEIKVY